MRNNELGLSVEILNFQTFRKPQNSRLKYLEIDIRFVNNTVRLVAIEFTFSVMKVKGLVFILNLYSL